MATTDQGFRFPTATDDPDVPGDIGNLAADLNAYLKLPDPVSATGSGTIVSAASAYAALPSPCAVNFTNPSSVYDLIVNVHMAGYLSNSGATGSVSIYSVAQGGMSWAATGYGSGGPLSIAETVICGANTSLGAGVSFPVRIPAGAATITFSVQAMRSNTDGSKVVQSAALRINPLRFVKP